MHSGPHEPDELPLPPTPLELLESLPGGPFAAALVLLATIGAVATVIIVRSIQNPGTALHRAKRNIDATSRQSSPVVATQTEMRSLENWLWPMR